MSKSLFGRTDLPRFDASAKAILNYIVNSFGGLRKRAGFQFLFGTKNNGDSRLVRFKFNNAQSYILEFSNLELRFIRDGQLLGAPFVLATFYTQAQLRELTFSQSADLMTITHVDHQPRELVRVSDAVWTLTDKPVGPSAGQITNLTLESGITVSTEFDITAITQADPGVFTTSAVPTFVDGDIVTIRGVVGMDEFNTEIWEITGLAGSDFSVKDVYSGEIIDTTLFGAYVSDGTVAEDFGRTFYEYAVTTIDATSFDEGRSLNKSSPNLTNLEAHVTDDGRFNKISWTAAPNAFRYNIYRGQNGVLGFVGSSTGLEFKDRNHSPDFFNSPPETNNIYLGVTANPSCSAYFQQRFTSGGSLKKPQSLDLSKIGKFNNFDFEFPILDDSPINFVLNALEVNQIQNLVPVKGGLMVFSDGLVWLVTGGGGKGTPITPTSIYADTEEERGIGLPPPVPVGNSILYIENRGSFIRDLVFDFDSGGYIGNDLTIFVNDLFKDHSIVEWGYAKLPDSLIWAIRDDGIFLTLTYVKEQNVFAWHQHETDGFIVSVATVPEGDRDALYAVIKRNIGGTDERFIERLHPSNFASVRDAFFVDSGLTFDNPVAISNISLSDPVLVTTATVHGLVNNDRADLSDIIGTTSLNLTQFIVTKVTDFAYKIADLGGNDVDGANLTTYVSGGFSRKALTVFSGLDHLEGEEVAVLGNGNVIPGITVSGGEVTLPSPVSRVHVGLAYKGEIETMDLNLVNVPMRGKEKNINEAVIKFEDSRGMLVGPDREHLTPIKERKQEAWNKEIELVNGDVKVPITSTWQREGSIIMQTPDPLPSTVLSVTLNANVGD